MRWVHAGRMLARGATIVGFAAIGLRAQGNPRACGVERWRVKVAMDDDAARIDTALVRSSVGALRRLPRPSTLPARGRAAPYELRMYRVIGVIRAILREDDGDLHLVVDDIEQPGLTMIAEIPDSACAVGSPLASRFADARRSLQGAPTDPIVALDGVGFFDYPHGQRGVAPNAFELHPITAVRVVGVAARAGGSLGGQDPDRHLVPDATPGSDTRVWVNTSSHVYHCPGTRWYGATKRGTYMTEREARAGGARSATGRPCGPPGSATP